MSSLIATQSLTTEKDTQALAVRLACAAQTGDVLFLDGPMGVGKTAFARFFIRHLTQANETVQSPTFPLMLTYDTQKGPLVHADLWRLTPDEVPALDLADLWPSHITLIEWPDRLQALSATPLRVKLSFIDAHKAGDRQVTIYGSQRWKARLTEERT